MDFCPNYMRLFPDCKVFPKSNDSFSPKYSLETRATYRIARARLDYRLSNYRSNSGLQYAASDGNQRIGGHVLNTSEATVSVDRKVVNVVATVNDCPVSCSITRIALERYFWAPVDASDSSLVKACDNGRQRILAVIERKHLRDKSKHIVLDVADFEPKF